MRFAVVSKFRGTTLVSIREYYDDEGELRPSRKGISLKTKEWQALLSHVERIGARITELDRS